MTIRTYHNATIQQYDNTTCIVILIQQHDNITIQQHNNTTQQNNMRIRQHLNTTAQQYDNSTWQNNIKIHQYHNICHNIVITTKQYDNTQISQYMSQYVCTFICIESFMIRLENLHEVVRIDNIRSTSDHGMNNICKLVIECKSVVFAWWIQKEFHQMSTTCNYLSDRIWIADGVRVFGVQH